MSRHVLTLSDATPRVSGALDLSENSPTGQAHNGPMSRGHGVKATVWFVALLLVIAGGPASAASPDDTSGDYSSQVVALVRDGSSVEVVTREVDSAREQQRVVDRLESDPDVQAIDVGFNRVSILADPYTPQQWAYQVLDFPESRRYANGSGVTIAVLDTGVAVKHKDLAGVVDTQRSFSTVPGEPDITDRHSHGTHVTGIIAAQVNGKGVEGLAPGATVVAGKVLNEEGVGEVSGIAEGIIRAADLGVDVISMSLGTTEYSDVLAASVDYAVSKGCLVVAAAGNDGHLYNLPLYPAALDNVLAVGATAANDSMAYFSTHGPYVDIAAPGLAILSTVPSPSDEESATKYSYLSGTSMAAPYVSAAAALVSSARSGLNAEEVRAALVSTAKDIGPAGDDPFSGAGRVVPAAAVALATSRTAPSPPPPWSGPVPDQETRPDSFVDYPKYELTVRPHFPTVTGTRYDYDASEVSLTLTRDGQPVVGDTWAGLQWSRTGSFDSQESPTSLTLHDGRFDGVVPMSLNGSPSSFVVRAYAMGVDAEAQVILVPQAVVHIRRQRIVANVFPNGVDCGGFEVHGRIGKGAWAKVKAGSGNYPFRYWAKRKAKVLKRSKWQVRINTCDGLTGERQLLSPTFKLSLRKSYRKSFRF